MKNKQLSILTSLSIFGTIGVAVQASKDTKKAIDKIALETRTKNGTFEFGDDGSCVYEPAKLTKKEIVKTSASCYIPTALLSAGTIACIVDSYIINKRTQKSLVNAYSMLLNAYQRLQLETESKDISDEGVTSYGKYEDVSSNPKALEKTLFYEEYSGRYFNSTLKKVSDAENKLINIVINRGYCELNDFYDLLELDPTDYGSAVGWDAKESVPDFINITTQDNNGVTCTTIRYGFPPVTDFYF